MLVDVAYTVSRISICAVILRNVAAKCWHIFTRLLGVTPYKEINKPKKTLVTNIKVLVDRGALYNFLHVSDRYYFSVI
jgi:hypothetical protein